MPTHRPQPPESPCRASATNEIRARREPRAGTHRRHALLAASAMFFAAQLVFCLALAAQTPATTPVPAQPTSHPAAHAPAHAHKKPAAAPPVAQPAPAPAPPAPQMPNWPANNKPSAASVVWDSHGLFIQASNSSLDQILREVSLKTGAKVEGMSTDQRIFGTYGPGPAREVLSQLLDGSGYNILMVGDQGEGTPRRIVLSGRPTTQQQPSGQSTPSENEAVQDEQQISEQEPQPDEPPRTVTPENAAAPPVPVRTPQQMLEQRQQMLQQMQPPQPQNGQQNPPN